MAIYKLKEISIIKNGKTPSTKKTIYWKKEIPFFGPGEFNQTPKRFITEMKGWTKPKNTILISTTATIGNITILNQRSWFNQQITSILVNKYHSSQYVYYYLLRKKHIFKKMSDGGTVFPIIHINSIRNLEINIPSLKEQQKIIDIIEPIELLEFNIKNIIKKINQIKKIFFNVIDKNVKKEFIIFDEIKTGKHNNNVVLSNGKFNFYSCSKNVKKSNFCSFYGEYIILSGNGEIYCWYENGYFDLYQRCYALKPKNDFFTSLFSIENFINEIRKKTSGSVIKYIKLNNLKTIPKLNNKFEKNLEYIFKYEFLLKKILNILITLKSKQIKLLLK